MQTLLFNHDDVQKLLPMKECVALMETTFQLLAQNRFTQPLRQVVKLPNNSNCCKSKAGSNSSATLDDNKVSISASSAQQACKAASSATTSAAAQATNVLANMPAHVVLPNATPPRSYMSSKIITVFPQNRSRGLESHQGVVMLFNGCNGQILSITDAAEITALRTAAVSAVAMKHLLLVPASAATKLASLKIAVLGAGMQALQHTHAIIAVLQSQKQLLQGSTSVEFKFWNRTKRHADELASDLAAETATAPNALKITFSAVETVSEAVHDADVIVTATSSTTPVLRLADGVKQGAIILAVGNCSPLGRELDADLVLKSKIVVDKMESAVAEAGDIIIAANSVKKSVQSMVTCELAQLVSLSTADNAGVAAARKTLALNEKDIVIFKSLGLAAEDLMSAIYIYEKEVKNLASAQQHHGSFCFTPIASHL